MAGAKTQYVLTGVKQDLGFRVFGFNGIGPDRTLTGYVVKAELSLALHYKIPLQELPLLCRELLEQQQQDGDTQRTLIFTEEQMRAHAEACAAQREAAQKRRSPFRRPAPENRQP